MIGWFNDISESAQTFEYEIHSEKIAIQFESKKKPNKLIEKSDIWNEKVR